MADAFSMRLVGDIGASLRGYAEEIRTQALRPAAYAMANVFYSEMRLRAPIYTGPIYTNPKTGIPRTRPGQLRDAIYHWHDDKKSSADRQIYAIGPNKKKAPHWHLVEYGTVKMAARPYVRPTFDGLAAWAVDTGRAHLAEKLQELNK